MAPNQPLGMGEHVREAILQCVVCPLRVAATAVQQRQHGLRCHRLWTEPIRTALARRRNIRDQHPDRIGRLVRTVRQLVVVHPQRIWQRPVDGDVSDYPLEPLAKLLAFGPWDRTVAN